MKHRLWLCAAVLVLASSLTPTLTSTQAAAQPCTAVDTITLQLKWVIQAQFAGYYAANEKGYYQEECLEVTLRPGGPDIIPEQVVARGSAQFGMVTQPRLLSFREQGTPLKTIAQVFQYSGQLEISWKESNIKSPADLKGKKVGVRLSKHALFATLAKYNLDPKKDVTIVTQPFDMNLLLQKQIDASAAMTYNELAQVLEVKNPANGKLYQLEDLNIIDFNKEGTAMLEDGIFVTEDWIKDPKNQGIAVRFLRASLKGWIYCRDNQDDCINVVLKAGPMLGKGHQTWQMNEINKLIWPSPNGIGIMDARLWQQTADIAWKYGVIKKPADKSAYTNEFVQKALEGVKNLDTTGLDWKPRVVQMTEGGK